MKTSDQLGRLLTLIPFLQANPGLTADEVAAHYRTTRRQVLSELSLLWMCGPSFAGGHQIELNMDEIEAGGPIELSNADYLTRPMRFTPAEAYGLVVSLAAIRDLVTTEESVAVDRALAKLTQLTGGAPVPKTAVEVATAGADLRGELSEAIRAGRRVRLTYDGASRGRTTWPVVEPVEIFVRQGAAYLQAWSVDRADWRSFRLDRIAGIEVLADPVTEVTTRPRPTAGEWVDAGDPVTLHLTASGAWLAEYDPVEEVDAHPDGSVDATFRMVDPNWLTRRLLQLGAAVTAVEPSDAAAPARQAAREAIELHNSITIS